jgi:hypothetical protein
VLRFGKHAEHLEDLADEDPDRIPAALLLKPELPEYLGHVYEAFMTLSRSRPLAVGMAGGIWLPIQTSEAIAMANAIGWEPIDFLRVIADADALYVEQINRTTK